MWWICLWSACTAILAGCGGGEGRRPLDGVRRGPATAAMAARLEGIAATVDPARYPTANAARLRVLEAREPPTDPRRRVVYWARRGQELLHVGRTEEAIRQLEQVLDTAAASGDRVPRDFVSTVRELLAISHLRLGLQDNCVGPHATERCLFPTPGAGVHVIDRGPRAAVRDYAAILEDEPRNLVARWLLNVGYGLLGEHPDRVPARWLIPARAFASEYDVGMFRDIAPALGVDVVGHAGGSIMDDFDGDGYLDLVTSSRHLRDQLRYFRNAADGSFVERTVEAGLSGIVGGLNLVQADYDNDGFLDILVLRGGWEAAGVPNSLLRNDGRGAFDDVTEEAGLLEPYPTQTGTWGDYDNDGWIDLFVGNESTGGREAPGQLFHNNGDGTFTDVARDAGVGVSGMIKGVVWGDVDNDGWLDLFVSRLGAANVLFRNMGVDASGQWRFRNVTEEAGVSAPVESFPTWFWDYDNDGWLDILVSGYRATSGDVAAEYLGLPHEAELPRLYRNRGDGTFEDATGRARLDRIMYAMGSNFGDLDNDGYLDAYFGTGFPDFRALVPNRMMRSDSGRLFQDVTTSGGFGHLGKGHGVAFGDIDNDGDQDIYQTVGGAYEGDVSPNVLFENPGHGHRWITLRLAGDGSNRAAIGARIDIALETARGERHVHRTVTSGGSFGASSLQQEIGLDDATAIGSVTIAWPATGLVSRYRQVPMNRIYLAREGIDSLETQSLRRLTLTRGSMR